MVEPKVSVIMPVFNGEEFLAEAIESILDQTLGDLELIVMSEHGTNEESLAIVEQFKDPRIRHVRNETRLGLIASLNEGIRLSRGKYIARMDSDDVSLPSRLEEQLRFMESNPKVGVVGTRVRYIDEDGKKGAVPRYFWRPGAVRWDMMFNSPIPHPSAFMRRELVVSLRGYDPSAYLIEDYDLWIRMSHEALIANLKDELVLIRKHGTNITVEKREEQNRRATQRAREEMSRILGEEVSEEIAHLMRSPKSISRKEMIVPVASAWCLLYKRFLEVNDLTSEEQGEIRRDLTRKLATLYSVSWTRGWGLESEIMDEGKKARLRKAPILLEGLTRTALRR